MVDVGRWSQPELGAALPRGIHDTEVILSWSEEGPLLFATQLSNHPKQVGDPLVGLPATGGGQDAVLVNAGRRRTRWDGGRTLNCSTC